MPKTSEKTKEELLVENAILKSYDVVREMLRSELNPLKKDVEDLTTKTGDLEDRLKAVEEVLQPFVTFRKKLWTWIITVLLSGAAIVLIYVEVRRFTK